MAFKIFKRKTWRKVNGKHMPYASTGQTVRTVEKYEDARAICMEANKNRPAYGTKGYYNFVYHEFTEA
jgi:hypothetical protein